MGARRLLGDIYLPIYAMVTVEAEVDQGTLSVRILFLSMSMVILRNVLFCTIKLQHESDQVALIYCLLRQEKRGRIFVISLLSSFMRRNYFGMSRTLQSSLEQIGVRPKFQKLLVSRCTGMAQISRDPNRSDIANLSITPGVRRT